MDGAVKFRVFSHSCRQTDNMLERRLNVAKMDKKRLPSLSQHVSKYD